MTKLSKCDESVKSCGVVDKYNCSTSVRHAFCLRTAFLASQHKPQSPPSLEITNVISDTPCDMSACHLLPVLIFGFAWIGKRKRKKKHMEEERGEALVTQKGRAT